MNAYQIHLKGSNSSGCGVRYRELSAPECDGLTRLALAEVGMEASMIDLRKAERREGAKAMIVAVTDPGLTSLDGAKWRTLTREQVEDEFNKLFNAKDQKFLCAVYEKLHEVSVVEVEEIMGKALPVTLD